MTRRSVLTVSLMLLLVACSSDTSTAPSNLSPEAAEATALVTEVFDSFDAGELEDGMAALAELTHRFGESTDPDVVGLADDAIKGYRLVIHATQDTVDGPFTLHSVERTYICWRGVDTTGLCV